MRETTVKVPVISMVAMTRGMLGAGAALLLGHRLGKEQRKAVGWSLVIAGVVTTLPLAMMVMEGSRPVHKKGVTKSLFRRAA